MPKAPHFLRLKIEDAKVGDVVKQHGTPTTILTIERSTYGRGWRVTFTSDPTRPEFLPADCVFTIPQP